MEGETLVVDGRELTLRAGVLRSYSVSSADQAQTGEVFGYKWHQRETFEGTIAVQMREWLVQRYGDVATAPWLNDREDPPILLDAGCGAALSALALFGAALDQIRYVGVDISEAVDVARQRFAAAGHAVGLIQADLHDIPLPPESVDLIFSEGVLHHCDSTESAFRSLVRLLKPGGRILFYVYRRKGPIREFTDEYLRDRLGAMTPADAWLALYPLTRLGKALGDLRVEVDIPEAVDLLDIPAGRIDVQRLFYWHVMKMFYRTDMTVDEMNHINFDWYAPRNAHRHTPEEVRGWCADAGLAIEREVVQDSGITVIARKTA